MSIIERKTVQFVCLLLSKHDNRKLLHMSATKYPRPTVRCLVIFRLYSRGRRQTRFSLNILRRVDYYVKKDSKQLLQNAFLIHGTFA